MKKIANCFFAVLLIMVFFLPNSFGVTNKRTDKKNKSNIEQYRLFNAEYNSTLQQKGNTTVFFEKRLFRINITTGETWILVDVLRDGKDIRYWKKIKNNFTK